MSVNYIAIDNDFNDVKKRNFYMYEVIAAFVWMCFHFTVVYFFMIKLENLMLVGIFLGFGNLVSFFADSPIGVIQNYFQQKKIFLFGAYLMLFVSLIFLYFIFATSSIELGQFSIFSKEAFKWLFSSLINVVLLILSATLYGIIKELSEVTSNSYIMNNSDPSEYSELFSKRSIFFGIGSGVGLVLSGIILALNTTFAVIILILLICFYIFFINRYFDNGEKEINLDTFKKIKLLTKDNIKNSINDYKTQILDNKLDLKEKIKDSKTIFLKPIELKNKINYKEVYQTTIKDLKSFAQIMFSEPYNYRLLVIGGIFVMFGFWDTFVTTFLIDYIDTILVNNSDELARFNLQNIFTAYVFVAVFCIPAFLGQIPLVGLSNKLGIWKIMIPGLVISGISMFIFGFSGSIYVLLLAGIMNGIGYAACMPVSQGEFSNEYNMTYSEKNKLKQIDANASSAPMKMLSNLANVLGLASGGILLQIFGYMGTFCLLGIIFLGLFVISFFKGKELNIT